VLLLNYMQKVPEPEKGFYYHYKHDPTKDVRNYAYEILNIAHHTEIDGLDESAMVVYRPLYKSSVYAAGKHWDVRPLAMFMENVIKEGKIFPRFQKITNPEVIAELEKIKSVMYSEK
jgi:hypothetical protein